MEGASPEEVHRITKNCQEVIFKFNEVIGELNEAYRQLSEYINEQNIDVIDYSSDQEILIRLRAMLQLILRDILHEQDIS